MKKRPVICVFGTRGFPGVQGGVEKHCECLYPLVAEKGYSVVLFRRKPYVDEASGNVIYSHIRFIDLPSTCMKGWEALFHSFLCTLSCLFLRPSLVHVHNIGPGCFIPILRLFGIPVVLTYHSANYEQRKWGTVAKRALRMSEYVALKWASSIIFVNPFRLEQQPDRVKRKSVYIPNGVSGFTRTAKEDCLRRYGLIAGKYILGVGRISPEKGFEILIEAFIRAKLSAEGYMLVIAGGMETEKAYYEQLRELGRGEKVCFTGSVGPEVLRQLYSHAALFVLSSFQEGFPMCLLEAMQAGCDVLLSDIPGTRMVALDENSYFTRGDVEELTRSMKQKLKLNRPERTYDLGEFDWKQIAEKTCRVYESLMEDC